MRVISQQRFMKLSVAALFGSVVLAFAGNALADDGWGWRHREHEQREHAWREHEWREHEWHEHHWAPRVVEERPVFVAPPPVFYAPPPVAYGPSGPPSMNLNFNIPLQ